MAKTKHLSLLWASFILLVSPVLVQVSWAQNCGPNAGGALCQSGNCCSMYGYCGTTSDYCGAGNCSSQCPASPSPPSGGTSGVGSIVTSVVFDQIFPQKISFYTYNDFISAASSFPSFGTTGASDVQAQEIAAFFAHVSHETGGLTKINEDNPPTNYCQDSTTYPCVAGQSYYGRGPLQISWNYNYGPAGQSSAISRDLLTDPGLVAQNALVSFQTAFWFWTTPQAPKPSCHDVMIGNWSPSSDDTAAGRARGFGLTIDIINGGIECGKTGQAQAADRVSLYRSICSTLNVDPGSNVDCENMQPYSS